MGDRARLVAFAIAVITVFGASYGIGAATDSGGSPDEGPAPVTTSTTGHGHG